MLNGTSFPVLAVPADASVLSDPGAEPLLFYTQVRGVLLAAAVAAC